VTVHDLLLQKSTGPFELVLWDENVKHTDEVTVNLGGKHAKVNIYDVTAGSEPVRSLTEVESVSLVLSDHAQIIEIIN
jgi:hypothetical protein